VPDDAEVYYYVRHPRMDVVDELFQRVVKIAEGAALGTETDMTYEVMHGNYSLMPNDTIQKIVHRNLEKLGGIKYSDDEKEYAQEIYQTLINPDLKMANSIKEIFENPEVIEISKQELKQRTGEDFIYKPLLGDREPPLNYRKIN
jgi:aminobenzoyl-glutamate utilization protein B